MQSRPVQQPNFQVSTHKEDLLNHLDTMNLARDMELTRRALNHDEKNFFSQSGVSLVGLTYGKLFPENIHRMAQDSILHYIQDKTQKLNDEAPTYEMTSCCCCCD